MMVSLCVALNLFVYIYSHRHHSMMLLSTMGAAATSVWLRIIQINDVYELDAFPSLYTLVQQYSSNGNSDSGAGGLLQQLSPIEEQQRAPDKTIVVCAGDFLAPSLLGSLDKGAGMVDCLNAVGVTHVCLGNHEADLGDEALKDAIQKKSNFTWINTNMPTLNDALQVETIPHDIVEVSNEQNTITKRVALLGLLTDDASLYRPGAFAGASIEPVLSSAKAYLDKLEASSSAAAVDVIIPLTHQDIVQDRDFCKRLLVGNGGRVPLVLGGHDHEIFDETVGTTRILKTGMDAETAAVIDLKWNDNDTDDDDDDDTAQSSAPVVSVQMLQTRDFTPDPAFVKRVQGHHLILRELEQSPLFQISHWLSTTTSTSSSQQQKQRGSFSTCNNRLRPSSGSTALASMIRMGMRAHCAIMNAGSIRASTDYDPDGYFTWSDLKAELPFSTGMVSVMIPGSVLEETVAHSRQWARQSPPIAKGGYLQTCNNVQFNDETQCIETIGREPFDPDRLYLTTLPLQFFRGIDNQVPLLQWAKEQGLQFSKESAIPAKMVLVQVFSAMIWLHLGSFQENDSDQDGALKRPEVKNRVTAIYGPEVADLVVDNIMAVADLNGDGTITPLEMMVVQFVATDILSHVCTKEELKAMKGVAAKVLGKEPSHDAVKQMVEKIRDAMDLKGDGKISRDEAMVALGELADAELLS